MSHLFRTSIITIVLAGACLWGHWALAGDDPSKHGWGGGPGLGKDIMRGTYYMKNKGKSSFAMTLNNSIIINSYADNTRKGQKRDAYIHRNRENQIIGIYPEKVEIMYEHRGDFSIEKNTITGTGGSNEPEPTFFSADSYDKHMIQLIEKKYGPMQKSGGRNIYQLHRGEGRGEGRGVKVTAEDLVYDVEKGVKIFFDDRLLSQALGRNGNDATLARLGRLGHSFAEARSLTEIDRAYRSFVNEVKSDFLQKDKQMITVSGVVLVSLKNIMDAVKMAESSGRVYPQDVSDLGGLTRVYGLARVAETDDLVLVGAAEKGGGAIGLDNLVTALKYVWKRGSVPTVSLDGDPTSVFAPKSVRVEGIPKRSRFSRIMLDADYKAKRILMGDPTLTLNVPDLMTLPEILHNEPIQGANGRIWLSPEQPEEGEIQISSDEDVILYETGVRVLTEEMQWVGRIHTGTGEINPASQKAVDSFTKHYRLIERELPVFRKLHALFDLVLLSKLLRQLMIDSPALSFIASLPDTPWEVADSYPAVVGEFEAGGRIYKFAGGVLTHNYIGHRHRLHYDADAMEQIRGAATSLSQSGAVSSCVDGITLKLVVPAGRHRYFNEGVMMLVQGKFQKADTWFTRVLTEDPFFDEAYVQRSHARINIGNLEGARKDIEVAIKLLPDDRMLKLIRFVLLIEMGSLIEQIKVEPETKAELANIIFERANIQYESGSTEVAMGSLDTALKLNPRNVASLSLRAWLRLLKKDYEGAYEDASKVVKIEPNSARAYSIRGAAAIALGPEDDEYYEDAYDDLTMALEIAPEVPEWWFNRASVMDAWGNKMERDSDLARGHEAAIGRYSCLLKYRPDDPMLYVLRGIAKTQAKLVKSALEDYNVALEKDPELGKAYMERARVFHSLEKYQSASEDASRAIMLVPNSAEAYAVRAAASSKMNRLEDALRDCNKALRLDPKYAYAYHIRALVKLDQEDPGGAIQDWEAAIEANPASEGFYRQLIKEASY